jgi:hypothetical protein
MRAKLEGGEGLFASRIGRPAPGAPEPRSAATPIVSGASVNLIFPRVC